MRGEPEVLRYIKWLRSYYKVGAIIRSGPTQETPSGFHKATVGVWISQLAGAGLLTRQSRGTYAVTRDLVEEDVNAVYDVFNLFVKRDRTKDEHYTKRNRGPRSTTPKVAAPPEPDPEIEIDVIEVLRQLGFSKSLTALQSLHDEILADSTGEQTKAELEKTKNEAAYLRSQNQTLEHTLQELRNQLKDSRAKALQLQTDLNLARQGVQRMAERKVFVPIKGSEQKESGATYSRPSGHVQHSRPVVMKKVPRGVMDAIRRKRK